MGAWGVGPFDNDSALDWLGEATGLDAEDALRDAFDVALELDYIDVDEGAAVVAAAHILAAALGRNTIESPEEASTMSNEVRSPDELRSVAVEALDAVLGEQSELAELRADDDAWSTSTRELREWLATP